MVEVACRIIVSAPVPVPFLLTLDFGFGTCIWDLGLGNGLDKLANLQNAKRSVVVRDNPVG